MESSLDGAGIYFRKPAVHNLTKQDYVPYLHSISHSCVAKAAFNATPNAVIDSNAQYKLQSSAIPTSSEEVDPLDLRFSILRQLVPHGSKLEDNNDILEVAFQYVIDLKQQIQDFYGDMDTTTEGMGELQRKGLCLVHLRQFARS
ncbi:hypothetical protein KP509_04G024300 [Ceratopteris richardii]|uniref:BHLH domain-containing protein n=1 Tax=Ceratopteris richardii TaxID=49495 RepID=A0A8T2UYK9_CERRI|nr:hypothetical protein KP509_04G024300 [Ceratopteris richardii]